MSEEPTYEDYVSDSDLAGKYLAYQQRYAESPRESDQVLLALIRDEVASSGDRALDVLDAGCSTGNLLRHLRRQLPDLHLTGSDLSKDALAACRADPGLQGVVFEELDVTRLGRADAFDVVIVNAVFYMMSDEEVRTGFQSVQEALRPGGVMFVFDFFHPYPQDLAILERSAGRPNGIMLHFRPMRAVERMLHDGGFSNVEFRPFQIPIDLQHGATYGDNESGFEDLNSYTVRTEDGARQLFRGTLFQPWCHLIARKAP